MDTDSEPRARRETLPNHQSEKFDTDSGREDVESSNAKSSSAGTQSIEVCYKTALSWPEH